MPAGVLIVPDRGSANVIDDAVRQARAAFEAGVRQLWLGQQFDYDAITLASVIGSAVPGVAVGTSVVPINPRHPLVVGAAAQTAQAATHGNFSLGLGLGVPFAEQLAFGIPATNTVQRLREYLTVLRAIIDDRTVDFHGTQITAVDPALLPVALAGSTPFPVYVAAMGPRALQVTGELADGTLPACTGPRTIEGFIAPTIAAAAADAGRPPPRIIALVWVAVTHDPDTVRAAAADSTAMYDQIPSYQKVLAREGKSQSC
jgi:F420-dependent oxidoreductase-like protein